MFGIECWSHSSQRCAVHGGNGVFGLSFSQLQGFGKFFNKLSDGSFDFQYDYEDPETRFKKTLRANTALPTAVNISKNREVRPIRQSVLSHQPKVEDVSAKIEPSV